MVEPITINILHLAQDVRLPQEQVQAVVALLDAGFPVPFIARYRKEVTQNLDEETLRNIEEELRTARVLCERKQTILKTIESAGKLTPELDKSIREAKSMKRLEDVYLPFRPKRQNLSVVARENGLEPFALEILEGTLPPDKVDERAAEFFNEDKKVNSIADVLLGAGHIIADILSCKAELVHKVREQLMQFGSITAVKIESPNAKKVVPKVDAASAPETEVPESTDATASSVEPIAEESIIEEIPDEITTDVTAVEDAVAEEGAIENTVTEEAETESAEETDTAEPETEETETEETETEESAPALVDETQEITELFEQIQEKKAEEGLPVVRSQNSLKKKKRAEAKKKLDEIKQRQREHFERQFTEYFQFSARLRGLPSHRILALNRGERHKILQVALKIDEGKTLEAVKEICVPKEHPHAEFLTGCLQDALHRVVLPTLIKEVRYDMTEYAEKNVIRSFSKNLRNQLLQHPLSKTRVLAVETSSKNTCYAIALDEFGNLVGHETVILTGNAERRERSLETLAGLVRKFNISVIAVASGNRIVEEAVAAMIEKYFADSVSADSVSADSVSADSVSADSVSADSVSYVMVNRTGVMTYAATATAKTELPYDDIFVRAAVSLGRRLQDPLSELIKADPAGLGIGMFHHEVRGNYLKQMLTDVVDSCVNVVGVDVNLASVQLLTHVAGLNPMTARRIYEHRREHGQFRCREDLKQVSGISEATFNYAAGFLRVYGGSNPLDTTNIHPENYELATQIIEKLGFTLIDLKDAEKVKALAEKILSEKIGELSIKLSPELGASLPAVRDILDVLSKPNKDFRDSQPPIIFRKTTLKFENLTPGTALSGTILNVADFGAFVDIGLHESGFIHVSQMSAGYIRDAHDRVSVGDTVHVWVVESDAGKKRISLTLLPPGTVKHTPGSHHENREHVNNERPQREHHEQHRDRHREHRDQRESSDRPPRGSARDFGGGKRPDRDRQFSGGRTFERTPKTFVSAPVKKEIKPITEKMKQGKEPMRSFSDLAQLLGHTQVEPEDKKNKK